MQPFRLALLAFAAMAHLTTIAQAQTKGRHAVPISVRCHRRDTDGESD